MAALVARKYKTDHHEIIVRPNSVDLVSKLVRHFDEPFADSSAIPTYLVSEFAAEHVKVVLTGDGGDELFAGYQSFFDIQRQRPMDRIPFAARKMLSTIADALPYSAYGKNYLRMISRPTALERYFEHESPHFLLKSLLTPEWMPPADAACLARTLAHCLLPNGADVLTQALYFEATAKLTGDMLVKVDRMSMANSLEVRCPMLDDRLAALAARIPHAWKLRNGRGKDIFIQALGDRLPSELLRQPKRGFGVPLAHWFRGSLRSFLWDHLTSASFLNRGIVSPEFVRYLLAEHDRARRNNYHTLWKLLMLELWFRDPGSAGAFSDRCLFQIIFWSAVFLPFYSYLGYPVVLLALRLVIRRDVTKQPITPFVSLLIPAYNEAGVIERKIENSLALDYPADRMEIVVASDGSSDATAMIAQTRADGKRIRVLAYAQNRGKVATLNASVPELHW